ncbi:MAG TPA: hypothetical protein VFD90_02680 [Gaiellales bacterium]|jgi:hypothetical protein|nr:hypothetical protein [Gaiellales bacterium]
MGIADGLAGLVVAIAIVVGILAIVEFWPLVIFGVELVVVAVAGGVHALLGRRVVVAESDGEIWSWTVKGQLASVRPAARVARAIREGVAFPPGGRFQRATSGEAA